MSKPGQFDRCWSCQAPIDEDSAVVITTEHRLPCCQHCWQTLHTADRLQLAREFWVGMPSRMHDRVRYELVRGKWTKEQVAP